MCYSTITLGLSIILDLSPDHWSSVDQDFCLWSSCCACSGQEQQTALGLSGNNGNQQWQ